MSRLGNLWGVVEQPVDHHEQVRLRGQELRRRQRLHLAESSSWPRLDLADLDFGRYYVTHTPSGKRYKLVRGEVVDAQFSPAVAWFIREGEPVFLEDV